MPGRSKRLCGAWSRRSGRPCRAKALAAGRCRNHGGVLRSPEGLKRATEAVILYWGEWRAQRGLQPTARWLALQAERAGNDGLETVSAPLAPNSRLRI